MKRTAIAALVVLSLGGCVGSQMLDVRNPTTGEFARCEVPANASRVPGSQGLFRITSSRACPTNLAAAGWEVVQ
jgi:hypothetical protein